MELGSGIALASVALTGGGVAITAIRSFVKSNNGNGHCSAHSGLVARLDSINKSQDRHEQWLKEISSDVKELLQR